MSAAYLREHLNLLLLERLEAEARGLNACPDYKRDLEAEIAECRSAFMCAAVVEIACLRAELSGRQMG